MSAPITAPPQEVVGAYRELQSASFRRFGTGLINATFLAEGPNGTWVLQGLHPAFAGTVNDDIAALTAHLRARGMLTPDLVRTRDGKTWCADENRRPWRVLSYVNGEAFDRVDSPARAVHAGELVGRFHAALSDFDHTYAFKREGVHDAAAHLRKLERALVDHASHVNAPAVRELAEQASRILHASMPTSALRMRHVHGDLKISNLLFAADGSGLCLIDLDTIAQQPLMFEMGDAMRSWTNPNGENVTAARVDESIFEGAMIGYARTAPAMSREERETIAPGLSYIASELSIRFLADALYESYFGWNSEKYATRGEHNLVRARGQLALARDAFARRGELEALVRAAWTKP